MNLSKLLGTAVMAMLALAVTASAASAVDRFHIEGTTGPFTVKAEQVEAENHVFTIENNLTTKCKKASFEGSQAGKTATTLTVTPVYTECTAFGLGVTVNMKACDFELLEPTAGLVSSVSIVGCAAGEPATITTGTCEITIGNQASKENVTFVNEATSPKTVLVKAAVTKLAYTKTKDGFLCPLAGTGTKEDAKYDGNTRVQGFEGAAQKGIFVE